MKNNKSNSGFRVRRARTKEDPTNGYYDAIERRAQERISSERRSKPNLDSYDGKQDDYN